jgi:hypothetical protein
MEVEAVAIDLSSQARDRLNSMLDGCFLNACYVDRHTGLGIAVLELTGVAVAGQRFGDAYPIVLAAYPVARIAVSFQVDGAVRELGLDDINVALQEFNFKEIDDWDIIDPPMDQRFRWADRLSFDSDLGRGKAEHFLELWQDESPSQVLDIAMWFQGLFIFDINLNTLTLEDLEEARERSERLRSVQVRDLGWLRTGVMPSFSSQEVVEKISGPPAGG